MSTFKDLDRLLQGFVDNGLPGCTLHVTQRGKMIYEGYFGWADIEDRVPVSDRSVFRMASMSKLPLYTTMMMLYERGKYLMTDPVGRYLPEWAESKKAVRGPTGTLSIVATERPINISDVLGAVVQTRVRHRIGIVDEFVHSFFSITNRSSSAPGSVPTQANPVFS